MFLVIWMDLQLVCLSQLIGFIFHFMNCNLVSWCSYALLLIIFLLQNWFDRKTCSLAFPRRLFIPWLAGTFICDYLQPSETPEVCTLGLLSRNANFILCTSDPLHLIYESYFTSVFWVFVVFMIFRS